MRKSSRRYRRYTNAVEQLRSFHEGKEPVGYNDKIRWLLVNDQMPEHVICCDKFLCRAYVAGRVGENSLRKIYHVAETVSGIRLDLLPDTFVIKANHDSGSVYRVTDRRSWRRAKKKLRKSLKNRFYGLRGAEWAYWYIRPRVFAEEMMMGPIVDYKFHCCDGKICWVQIIYDRDSGHPREVNVDEDNNPLGLHLDQNFIFEAEPPDAPEPWNEMKELARSLSRGFKYVRVDLYANLGEPSFGELTFWPRAGDYHTGDNLEFGNLLNIDTSWRRPAIHDFFSYDPTG